ncbi:hypothetical protein AAVH_08410 [Aphelenchoides avenae]|nr:hypothetical protein AAVH_08410 [Aphelenchus avenae]
MSSDDADTQPAVDDYQVEEILQHDVVESLRKQRATGVRRELDPSQVLFKVRWLGYGPEDDTWETADDLEHLKAFEEYCSKHGLHGEDRYASGATEETSRTPSPVTVVGKDSCAGTKMTQSRLEERARIFRGYVPVKTAVLVVTAVWLLGAFYFIPLYISKLSRVQLPGHVFIISGYVGIVCLLYAIRMEKRHFLWPFMAHAALAITMLLVGEAYGRTSCRVYDSKLRCEYFLGATFGYVVRYWTMIALFSIAIYVVFKYYQFLREKDRKLTAATTAIVA